ncbi:class I SAM-dependent methyltransferase [Streptomyces uncialis]|uniref:Ubiquinone biosynthesis methyltransferase UbiE n=1 Tax=Streptomyces uncialis TaxID=1048205 RepID=A0A1Q4V3T1_9ACTN|nr:class I SAM-dependent methyltransferase [Streptomyces uncialis]OKH92464.1 ubiquinone biosynthesis methyltransferase UbiE [Streptomyces uncialis]WTE09843.1 class I SAM-dependent methyltransferase [Streptomyces uncialis]
MTLLRDDDLSDAFDHASRTYDRLVAVNPGYHAQLRRSARRLGLPHGGAGLRVLDLGCGTGASTAALLSVAPRARITAVDVSEGMLDRARAKRWPPSVSFVRSPAEALCDHQVGGPFDAVFAAYLFRNLTDPDRVLTSLRALLAPGGRFAAHEYALSGRPAHRAVWRAVCAGVVLPAGTLTGDRVLYKHLLSSVTRFDTAPAFGERVRRAGFERVRVLPVSGWQTGVVHTVVAAAPGGGAA